MQAITGLPCTTDSQVRASGTLESHYSPVAKVELMTEDELLNRDFADATVGLIALAVIPTPTGAVRLCAPQTVSDYAQQLYAALRKADALQLVSVLAIAPTQTGIGAAIVDRLMRAAHAN